MIEKIIKRFVSEHHTLMVVLIGVLFICLIYWWFFCKDKPLVGKVKGGIYTLNLIGYKINGKFALVRIPVRDCYECEYNGKYLEEIRELLQFAPINVIILQILKEDFGLSWFAALKYLANPYVLDKLLEEKKGSGDAINQETLDILNGYKKEYGNDNTIVFNEILELCSSRKSPHYFDVKDPFLNKAFEELDNFLRDFCRYALFCGQTLIKTVNSNLLQDILYDFQTAGMGFNLRHWFRPGKLYEIDGDRGFNFIDADVLNGKEVVVKKCEYLKNWAMADIYPNNCLAHLLLSISSMGEYYDGATEEVIKEMMLTAAALVFLFNASCGVEMEAGCNTMISSVAFFLFEDTFNAFRKKGGDDGTIREIEEMVLNPPKE